MAKNKNKTHAGKPEGGTKGELPGGLGAVDPGVVKGAGGDISGKHPPTYYDEIELEDDEEIDED